jgi:hypothetical protein
LLKFCSKKAPVSRSANYSVMTKIQKRSKRSKSDGKHGFAFRGSGQ